MNRHFFSFSSSHFRYVCSIPLFHFLFFLFFHNHITSLTQSATNEQIDECFNVFDKAKNGYLNKEQVGQVIRALGKNPTEKQLQELLAEAGNDKIDSAKLKTLYKSKNAGRAPGDMDKEMRDAFKALDANQNGRVQETELRQILGNLGDALTSQEVNSLMREVKVDPQGGVGKERIQKNHNDSNQFTFVFFFFFSPTDYNAFVDILVSSYPVGDRL